MFCYALAKSVLPDINGDADKAVKYYITTDTKMSVKDQTQLFVHLCQLVQKQYGTETTQKLKAMSDDIDRQTKTVSGTAKQQMQMSVRRLINFMKIRCNNPQSIVSRHIAVWTIDVHILLSKANFIG